ncbi:MAG: FemAB family XrtA/PEP-CTERM system-associated protein, partial [Pseudomonadota bacterium]
DRVEDAISLLLGVPAGSTADPDSVYGRVAPFATYGGPLFDDQDAEQALYQAALHLGGELKVGAIEYRLRTASSTDKPTKTLYETFSKTISDDPDENMKAIRSKQRNIIRKGIKAGLEGRASDLETFYEVYSESVRNLGTPVFPKQLFKGIKAAFGNEVEFFTAFSGPTAISSAMLFYFRNEVCPYYWGGVFAARKVAGNDFLCWEIINRAAQRGCTIFDFGRSKVDTGAHKWKQNLGFEATPLAYEYDLVADETIPEVNPNNPKYRYMIETWKRLPLPLSRVLGPIVSKHLG